MEGWILLGALILGYDTWAVSHHRPTMSTVARRVANHHPAVKITLAVGWAALGHHLFARRQPEG